MLLLPFKRLCVGTRTPGSGALYSVASRWPPSGVLLRPNGASGVSSLCRHVYSAGAIKATSLPLLVSDVAYVKVSWPI